MPVNGTRRPNFILFVSGTVSSQWLEIQRNEKPSCFLHSPLGVFLLKTAHLVQFLPAVPQFPFPLLGSTDGSTTWTFHAAFDDSHLFHSPICLLNFSSVSGCSHWENSVGLGGCRCPGRRMCHIWQSHRRVHVQLHEPLGTGTVLQGHCLWWQQDSSVPGQFLFTVLQMYIPGWCCSL